MTESERDLLAARYIEIGDELQSLAVARGAKGKPGDVELALRVEQDEIERLLGVETFEPDQ